MSVEDGDAGDGSRMAYCPRCGCRIGVHDGIYALAAFAGRHVNSRACLAHAASGEAFHDGLEPAYDLAAELEALGVALVRRLTASENMPSGALSVWSWAPRWALRLMAASVLTGYERRALVALAAAREDVRQLAEVYAARDGLRSAVALEGLRLYLQDGVTGGRGAQAPGGRGA